MTFREGLAHLQARAVQMRRKRMSYNSLRWTKGDVEAVEAILAGVAKAIQKQEQRAARERAAT